ncbi:MAG TPA: peptidylprolyl isomerase [Steroidobacteraceae bacterium]
MIVDQDSVVTIHYTLRDDAGRVLDSSEPQEPISYLHGHGNLVPGLERELTGKSVGDKLNVKLSPAEGYGERDEQLVHQVPRRALQGIDNISVGMRLHARTQHGTTVVTVTKVAGDMVTLDGNHPLAGQTLNFEVEIADIRPATAEELSHGHVHGPGGHDH